MDQVPLRITEPLIVPAALDPDAVKIVRRLRRYGHEAYLVGGCVRDLSLGHIPKDFDIATSARPRQIKRLFRNSRIIGRRFKLVHVQFGQKVIEVSTFRQKPKPGQSDSDETSSETNEGQGDGFEPQSELTADAAASDGDEPLDADAGEGPASDADVDIDAETDGDADEDLLIRRDNVFGTAEEDALRRDFTINALFYDVDDNVVIDYVGGTADLEERLIRTIGDPVVRFPEDPVRILRAIKFAARLSFHIDPSTYDAMVRFAPDLHRCAAPRLSEELLKVLSCGAAAGSFELLERTGTLSVILPELAEQLQSGIAPEQDGMDARARLLRRLDALDQADRGRRGFPNAVYFTALFADLVRGVLANGDSEVDPGVLIDEVLRPAAQRMSISRRDAFLIKQIVLAQSRLKKTKSGGRRRRVKPTEYVRRDYFDAAFSFLRIETLAYDLDPSHVQRWEEVLDQVFGRRRRGHDDGRHFPSAPPRAGGRPHDEPQGDDRDDEDAVADGAFAAANQGAGTDADESDDDVASANAEDIEDGVLGDGTAQPDPNAEPGEQRGRRRRRRRGGRNRNRNRQDRDGRDAREPEGSDASPAPADRDAADAPIDSEQQGEVIPAGTHADQGSEPFDDAANDPRSPAAGGGRGQGRQNEEGARRGRRRGRGRGRNRDREAPQGERDRPGTTDPHADFEDRPGPVEPAPVAQSEPPADAADEPDFFVEWNAPLPTVGDPGPISMIRTGIDQTEKKGGRYRKRRMDSAARDLSKEIEDQPSLQALKMTEGDPRGHEATRPQKPRRSEPEPEQRAREKPFDFERDFESIEDVFPW